MADDPITRAFRHIDKHLFEPLTLEELAGVAGLSPFHFSRLFTALVGESVMAYVRGRRLGVAARRLLAEPDLKLIDLALDCQFELQEAFARAFKRTFSMTPGEFRRGRGEFVPANFGEMKMNEPAKINLTRQDGLKTRPGFVIAGFAGTFGLENRADIPALWGKLVKQMPLAGQKGWVTYGACIGGDLKDGDMKYMAAVEIDPEANLPAKGGEGIETFNVPAQSYLVFRQVVSEGPLHPQVVAAVGEIFSKLVLAAGYELSGGVDFELYPEDFEDKAGKWLEYWVPVKV